MNLFGWFLNFFLLIVMLFIEKITLNKDKIYSPVFFLGVPFLFFSLIAIFLAPYLGFVQVNFYVLLVWGTGLFLFWVSGFGLNMSISEKKLKRDTPANSDSKIPKNIHSFKIPSFLILFSTLILFKAVRISSGATIHFFASDNFSSELGSGLYGWYRIGVLVLLPYQLCQLDFKKTNFFNLFSVLLGIITLAIYQIKGIFLMPFIVFFVYSLQTKKGSFSIFKIIRLIIIGFIVFYLSYAMPYVLANEIDTVTTSEFFKFIIEKIINYFLAGILAISELVNKNMKLTEPSYTVITPFYNILRRLWGGDRINPVLSTFMPISSNFTSNVYTFFGNIWALSGWFGLVIYSIVSGFISYRLYFLVKYKKSKWLMILYSVLCAYLILGIFDNYFHQTYVLIVMVIMYILSILEIHKKNKLF